MSEHVAKQTRVQMSQAAGAAAEAGVGKRTLVEALPPSPSLVQRAKTGAGGEAGEAGVHAAAAHGTATPGSRLPFHDTIQRAFGPHDISSVKAHAGGEAAASAHAMGAQAYATGDHVVLSDASDLHTVAHEAAHVVQQRGGVQLKGGVGQAGDSYEHNADAVADRVVQGKSAVDLLGPGSGAGSAAPSAGVQHKILKASTAPYESFLEVERAMASAGIELNGGQRAALQQLHAADQPHAFNDALAVARGGVQGAPATGVLDQELNAYLQAHPSLQQQLPYPHTLHFIWSGRPISGAAMSNLELWAGLARQANWKINIWTDKKQSSWGYPEGSPRFGCIGIRNCSGTSREFRE